MERIVIPTGSRNALVLLHPDAVFKGQRIQPSQRLFILNMDKVDDLEPRVRMAESSLGIPSSDGVVIIYDRKPMTAAENIGPLLVTAVFIGIVMLIRRFSGGMGNLNPFQR